LDISFGSVSDCVGVEFDLRLENSIDWVGQN